jgi:hypothetical protein
MDWLSRSRRSRPQDPEVESRPDKTPRMLAARKCCKDEGIVQAFSKEREQLSRRLHQKHGFPGEIRGTRPLWRRVRFAMAFVSEPKQLQSDDAAYIAGLIDGEGTITLTRLHASENRRLVVSITSTEIRLLEFVLETFGAGKITRKRTTSVRHSPSFCYAVTSLQALSLLRQTSAYLRSYKSRRAMLALEQYELLTPRNGKYSVELLEKRRHFEETMLSLRADKDFRVRDAGQP